MSARKTFAIGSEQLTIELCREYLETGFELTLSPEAIKRIEHCRNYLDRKVEEVDKPIYGVTTGFGSLCNRTISPDQLTKLQENIVKSHACSCGDEVSAPIIRLMLLLKAHALQIGNSGVQVVTVQRIVDMLNADVLPIVYDRGSLGASGDLAPLANLFLPLIGYGEVRYKGKNIAEVLDMSVEEAAQFFSSIPAISSKLETLLSVGLGYIRLGQSALTLSGGEAQRVKLATELSKRSTGKTLYIMDEPTTGLHFADVKMLMSVIQRLVDNGNTVLMIEHNLDVILQADHIIDLGPEGGDKGGNIVAIGTPEEVATCDASYTGHYIKEMLNKK